jgi:hypothetical protein
MNLKSLALLLIGSATIFAATIDGIDACPTGQTLAAYSDPNDGFGIPSGGSCSIGQLKYYNFSFSKLKVDSTSDVSNYLINAEDLLIVIDESKSSFGILPDISSLFNRTITVPERYLITYTIDPPPIIAGDELYLDPPTNSSIYARKWLCTDSNFTSSVSMQNALLGVAPGDYTATMGGTFGCDSNPASAPYFLKADGTSPTEEFVKDIVYFPSPAYKLDVRLVLDFQPGTIEGFDGTLPTAILTAVPEPSTYATMLTSLVGAACLLRRKRKA